MQATHPATLEELVFNTDGLIPVIAQHAGSGEVLMMAWANREALKMTLDSREAWYWSRSRQSLWHKGATSGQIQKIIEIRADCDGDCVLFRVLPQGDGGACHLGYRSCFFRTL